MIAALSRLRNSFFPGDAIKTAANWSSMAEIPHLQTSFTVVIVSGSIAAANTHGLVDLLREARGEPVIAILTGHAMQFVSIDTVRYAGGAAAVVTETSSPLTNQPDHIYLAKRLSGLLVYPASANFIARAATGLASDVASLTFLASHHKPRMMIPSTNPLMWSNPMIQDHLLRLRGYGVNIADSPNGLAPGVSAVANNFCNWMRELAADSNPGDIVHRHTGS